MLLAFALVIYFVSQLGGCYFDFVSRTAVVDSLKAEWIRYGFMLIFALFGIGAIASLFRR
jgi:hypothetical protein